MAKIPFPFSHTLSTMPLQLLHYDVWRPSSVASFQGYANYVNFVSDVSDVLN